MLSLFAAIESNLPQFTLPAPTQPHNAQPHNAAYKATHQPRESTSKHQHMTLSMNSYNPKKESKRPRRRVTVDCLSSTVDFHAQQHLGKMPRRRSDPSLAKKNVSFSTEKSHVCVDRHSYDDLSTVEKWYSCDDQMRFKVDRTLDVHSFRKQAASVAKKVATTDVMCPVGIEQFLSVKGAEIAKSNRKHVIQTVLLEQTRQRAFGFRDPDQLAFLAEQASTESMKGAQKRGKFQEMSRFV